MAVGQMQIPVTVQSKVWVCACSLAGIAGSNPAGDIEVCLLSVVCYQVDVSASSLSPVQRSHVKCKVSEYDREASRKKRRWPGRGCCAMGGEICQRTCGKQNAPLRLNGNAAKYAKLKA